MFTKVYKAVVVKEGKKKSAFVSRQKHTVTYRKFLPSFPKVKNSPLFCFKTVDKALSWGGFGGDNGLQLYECLAVVWEKQPYTILSVCKALSYSAVKNFWNKKGPKTSDSGWFIPLGTVFCSVVIPIRRVK